jgi:hypothetical protein
MTGLSRLAVLSGILLHPSPAWAVAPASGHTPPPSTEAQAEAPRSQCIAFSRQSLRFGEQRLNTPSSPETVILSNRAKRSLALRLEVAGDFLLDAPTSPFILAPGASAAAVVRFRPGREGPAAGALVVSGCDSPRPLSLWGITAGWPGLVCSEARLQNVALAIVLSLMYWLAMVIVRWNRVAMPSRFVLRAQIASVESELQSLQDFAPPAQGPGPGIHAGELLTAAGRLIDGPREVSGNPFLNCMFWSRGQEITGWGYTYEAQKQMVPLLPEPTVRARLEVTASQLGLVDDQICRTLAESAKNTLAAQVPPPLERLRALLAEALSAWYDQEYNSYADLVSWQNKTSWLVGCCLLLIVVLTGAFPNQSILFLVGAAGGLLSRLSRSLNRKEAPTDYGASWTTLFLSPVAGALGAWVGVLVASLAAKLNILGGAWGVGWSDAFEPTVLAVALAFGFSERLLDSVFDKLDEKSLNQTAKSGTTTSSSTLRILDPGSIQSSAAQPVQLQTTGAVGSVSWSLVQPAPPGVAITRAGSLTWAPLAAGQVLTVTVQAADSATNATAVQPLTIR